MKVGTKSDNVWFTTKGQVVIPLWMRKEFHIEEGSRAVVVVTDGGILLKPVTKRAIAPFAWHSKAQAGRQIFHGGMGGAQE